MTQQTPIRRREDPRLLKGEGHYAGDRLPEGCAQMVFLRAPHAHADLVRLDTGAARAMPGVLAVLTAADLEAAGLRGMAGGFGTGRADGSPAPDTPRPVLVKDRVRALGEAVAAVVAETAAQAQDAAEAIEADYEVRPVVTAANALAADAPLVWDNAPGNVAFDWSAGDASATEAALQAGAHVTRQELSVSRVTAAPLETRVMLAVPGENGALTVRASHQAPFGLKGGLEGAGFDGPLRVEIGDVGGSFGMKGGLQLEAVPLALAARQLGRPVLWEGSRSDAFLSDDQAREQRAVVELGFDKDHRITALRVRVDANVGAWITGKAGWSISNIGGVAGVYDIPAIRAEVRGVLTNTPLQAAYRGAGRPEATYLVERALDVAAAELGLSPLDLRRRNLIPAEAMPYDTALLFNYDCGDFAANMDQAEALADVAGFEARRREAEARGKLRGLGVANCIEVAGGPYSKVNPDQAGADLMADGTLRLRPGSMSVGQGFETVFPRMVADRLGVDPGQVVHAQGDTDLLDWGKGNGGSGQLCVGGGAVHAVTEALRAALIERAAERFGATAAEVTLEDGLLRAGNETLTLAELAAEMEPDAEGAVLRCKETFRPEAPTYPNATHICEVEVDPETGEVELIAYSAVEDIGTVIAPQLARGQLHGGIVQGIGQALGEEIVLDDSGELLTGSFMDYQMPRASDLPMFRLDFNPVPTKMNPLGAKGVGEAGTVGGLSAMANAVNAALATRGVRHLDMPTTPLRVWQALREAGQGANRGGT